MPHPTPQLQPARQVERIREILVGRQMQSVEHRLERLEQQLTPMPVDADGSVFETRLEENRRETREALREMQDHVDAERLRLHEETRRLAARIESVARARHEAAEEARRALEADLRPWFEQWQEGLRQHLEQREQWLIGELRGELDRLRAAIPQAAAGGGATPAGLRDAFDDLARSARRIAESLPSAP